MGDLYDDYGIQNWLERGDVEQNRTCPPSQDELCEGLMEIRRRVLLGPLRNSSKQFSSSDANYNSDNGDESPQKFSSFRYFAPFFLQIRKAFARYRHEGNIKILQILTGIVSDSISFIQDRAIQLQPLIPDLIFNLMHEGLQRDTEELLIRLTDEEDCVEMIQAEMEIAILNSNNKAFIETINSFSNRSRYGNKQRTRKQSFNDSGDKVAQSIEGLGFGNEFGLNFSNNIEKKVYEDGGFKSPRIMDISFLPHSITEQWLLAKSINELTVVLDDIISLYDSLPTIAREKTKQDLPKLLRHISQNLTFEIYEVTMQCIKLLDMIAQDNVDYFGPHLHTIFPQLLKGLDGTQEQLRSSCLKFICFLVANISFCLTTKWILQALDFKKKKGKQYLLDAMKVASMGILKCTQESGSVLVGSDRISLLRISTAAAAHLVDQLNGANGDSGETNELALDVIASSMSLLFPSNSATQETVFLKFLDMIVPEASGQKLDYDIQNSILGRATSGDKSLAFSSLRTDKNIAEIFKTVTKDYSSFSSKLPTYEDLAVSETFTLLSPFEDDDDLAFDPNEYKANPYTSTESNKEEVVMVGGMTRVKDSTLSLPSTITNTITSMYIEKRDAPTSSGNMKEAKEGLRDNMESSSSAEDEDPLARTLSYVPSWSKDLKLDSTVKAWGEGGYHDDPSIAPDDPLNVSSERSIDRSKLKALKTSTKKGAGDQRRRAHSAEVTKIDNFGIDGDADRITSFTSDGNTSRDMSGTKKALGGISGDDNDADDRGSATHLKTMGKLFNSFQPNVPSFLEENERMNRLRESFMDKVKMQLLEAASSGDKDKDRTKRTKTKRRQANGGGSGGSIASVSEEKVKEDQERSSGSATTRKGYNKAAMEVSEPPHRSSAARGEDASSTTAAVGSTKQQSLSAVAPLFLSLLEQSPADEFDRPIRPMKIDTSFETANDEEGYYSATSLLATPIAVSKKNHVLAHNHTPSSSSSYRIREVADDRGQGDRGEKNLLSSVLRSPRQVSPRQVSPRRDEGSKKNPSAAPSSLKVESFEYLDTEEIEPSPTPSKDLNKVVTGLERDDWPDIFHTLTSLRRLGLHHPAVVYSSGGLHSIVVGVLKQVDNLRSAVAKNAILTIGDLFQGMGSRMDAEVPNIISYLLKRCGDTSNFLTDVADNAILQMSDNITPSRSLSALLLGTGHKNAAVRGKVASFIGHLLVRKSDELRGSRELDELKSRLGKMLSDSTPEARSSTRSIVRALLDQNLASHSELEQTLTSATLRKALTLNSTPSPSPKRVTRKEFNLVSPVASEKGSLMKPSPLFMPGVEYGEGSGVGDSSNDSDSPQTITKKMSGKSSGSGNGSSTPSRAKVIQAKKLMETSEDLQRLPQIVSSLENNEWNNRKEALTQLCDILLNHSVTIKETGKLDYYMDRMYEKLEDGSLKVQLHALSCIQKLHQQIPFVFNVNFALPAFLNVSSFSNKQISSCGSVFLEEYISSLPLPVVVSQLCSTALHEKERLKVKAFKVLGGLNLGTSQDGIAIAKKHVFPTICQALLNNASKGDIRVAAVDTLKSLAHELESNNQSPGERIYNWGESLKQQEEIKKLLKAS